jgi:hypothetical protein
MNALLSLLLCGQVSAKKIEVPIEVGLGPSILNVTGPVAADQPAHFAISLSGEAVISKKLIKQNKKMIPRQYRKKVMKMDEIRISSIYLPDMLIISPKTRNVGLYGISWRPVSMGVPLIKGPASLKAGVGLRLTAAYLDSSLPSLESTLFLRPGLDAKIQTQIPLGKSFGLTAGWCSQVYLPQELGGAVDAVDPTGDLSNSIWHIGQAYVRLNYRFPYKTRI